MKELANSWWPALTGTVEEPPRDPAMARDPALLTALAASGARLGSAASLPEWRAILAHEVARYLPGAECIIYLSPEWPSVLQTPGELPLVVPLECRDRRLGRMIVRPPAGAGGPGTRALLDVLAQFAAVRLADLPDRTTAALESAERERRLLDCVQGPAQVLASWHDRQALFDEVVRRAAQLTGGETATLLLDEPQGRGLILQAEWGHADGERPRCYLGRWGVAGLVITRGQIVLIDHAPSDPRYAAPACGRAAKSLIGVPLWRDGQVIGALNVSSHTRFFAFSQTHVDLLTMLAHYATVGIEMADRLAEREARNADLQQLNGTLTALYEQIPPVDQAGLDLPGLMTHLLAQTQTVTALEGAAAFLYDAATDDWQVVAEVGRLPSYWPLPPAQQRAALDHLRRAGEPVRHSPPGAGGGHLLLMPLLMDGAPLGAFALPVPAGHSLDVKLPFLHALVRRAAMLVYNIQLQLRAEELLILEERNRIAQAMHDGLAQNLTQIRIRCEVIDRILTSDPARAARELAGVRADLKRSTAELVRVINALALPPLGEDGLCAALQKLGEEFSRPGRLRVEVVVPPLPLALPPQLELTLFRVAQESLRNAIWHLGADYCRVVLRGEAEEIILSVEDNGPVTGPGSSAGAPAGAALYHNLARIQHRATEFGGTLNVVNTPGVGTQLVVVLPRTGARTTAVRAGEKR